MRKVMIVNASGLWNESNDEIGPAHIVGSMLLGPATYALRHDGYSVFSSCQLILLLANQESQITLEVGAANLSTTKCNE
ncbi:MAG: hypothetical protein ACP5HZ_10705 [Ferrimicrobium sp.]